MSVDMPDYILSELCQGRLHSEIMADVFCNDQRGLLRRYVTDVGVPGRLQNGFNKGFRASFVSFGSLGTWRRA